jgi:hypothetical protein
MSVYIWYKNQTDVSAGLKHFKISYGSHPLETQVADSIVVNWGHTKATSLYPGKGWLMNPPNKVKRAGDQAFVRKCLEIQGLRTQSDSEQKQNPMIHQHYTIPVFHLRALTVFSQQSGPVYVNPKAHVTQALEEMGWVNNQRFRYMTRQAVRAIYALGLDFGLVHLGLNARGRAVILSVEPCPVLTPRLGELFAGAIHQLEEEALACENSEADLLLGMDPECILVNAEGKVVPADRYFVKKGTVGCDSLVLPGREVIYPLLEFRPHPQSSPNQLMEQLRLEMQKTERYLHGEGLKWLAGGMPRKGFALGGHLHFSGRPMDSRWLRALDHYLALPLILLEAESTGKRRPRYGFLGDHRRKKHGGFEYRTLPSWMVEPEITQAVLIVALLIADHYKELQCDLLDEMNTLKAYYTGDKTAILIWVEALWRRLEKVKGYALYHDQLEAFKQRLLQQEPWDEQADIRKDWGLIGAEPFNAAAVFPNHAKIHS